MSTKQPDTLYETRGAAKARHAGHGRMRRLRSWQLASARLRPAFTRRACARRVQEAQEGKLKGAAEAATQGELKARRRRGARASSRASDVLARGASWAPACRARRASR
jgi:hypothetical protein